MKIIDNLRHLRSMAVNLNLKLNLNINNMIITLVKEIHPENRRVRYSIEKDGLFVDGTVTTREDVARRMYEAAKHSGGNTIWEREVLEQVQVPN